MGNVVCSFNAGEVMRGNVGVHVRAALLLTSSAVARPSAKRVTSAIRAGSVAFGAGSGQRPSQKKRFRTADRSQRSGAEVVDMPMHVLHAAGLTSLPRPLKADTTATVLARNGRFA